MSDEVRAAGPAVALQDVAAGYGGEQVLDDLTFHLERGEFAGVVGPSGSGKTTLLRLLTGRADRHRGSLEVLGHPVSRGHAPPGVGYVPQLEGVDFDFPLTVEQVVLLGASAASASVPWFSGSEKRRGRELLDRLGLEGMHGRHIRELSGGQRQRMFLARALLRDCELLLLDEPTSGVDLATRGDMLRLLGELHHLGLTVLLTTHDLNFVAAHLPRVVCLNGAVTADGSPREVLTPEALERTYGAPMRVLHDGDRVVVVDAEPIHLHAGPDHLAADGSTLHTDPAPGGPAAPHQDGTPEGRTPEATTAVGADPDDGTEATTAVGADPDDGTEATTAVGADPDDGTEATTAVGADPDDGTEDGGGARPRDRERP